MADIFLFDVCGTSTCSLCAKYHAIFSDPWFLGNLDRFSGHDQAWGAIGV